MRGGVEHERHGRLSEALDLYAAAIECAGPRDAAVLSEALRHVALLHHLRAEPDAARDYGERAVAVALEGGAPVVAAEALNALGSFAFEAGRHDDAQELYEQALQLVREPSVVRKVEHNLGILHNVRGEWAEAAAHYAKAAEAAEAQGDCRAAAVAYHNLGMVAADRGQWEEAYRQYRRAMGTAVMLGDRHLEALCRLNQAEVHLALDRWDDARQDAERALAVFDHLDARRDKADATRILGVVFRETRRPALAESRLRSAIELAVSTACPLSEAEARRELGELHRQRGRLIEARAEFDAASRLFAQLGARADVADVDSRLERLQAA